MRGLISAGESTPLKYEPVEVFMAEVDQSKVDKSTEEWLDGIEDRLMGSGIVGIIIRRRRWGEWRYV